MKKGERSLHLVKDEEKRWKTTPLGVKILVFYTGILAFFYLLFALTIPTNIFFGFVAFGIVARALNLLFLAVLGIMLAGFLLKKHWAGGIAFGFFLFEILNLCVSFIARYSIMRQAFVLITSFSVILLNSLILWYIYEKRGYFSDLRHFKSGKSDRFFVTAILFLAAMVIMSTITYGTSLYKTTIKLTDRVAEELKGKTREQAMFRCSFYEKEEKDVCYLVAAAAYEDMPAYVCDEIDNNFYRLTCMQAVMT